MDVRLKMMLGFDPGKLVNPDSEELPVKQIMKSLGALGWTARDLHYLLMVSEEKVLSLAALFDIRLPDEPARNDIPLPSSPMSRRTITDLGLSPDDQTFLLAARFLQEGFDESE